MNINEVSYYSTSKLGFSGYIIRMYIVECMQNVPCSAGMLRRGRGTLTNSY